MGFLQRATPEVGPEEGTVGWVAAVFIGARAPASPIRGPPSVMYPLFTSAPAKRHQRRQDSKDDDDSRDDQDELQPVPLLGLYPF